MSNQKALLLHSKDAGKYEVGTRPIPSPGAGQVLIKVCAAALNPIDNYILSSGFIVEHYGFPAVPGSDGAGIIEAIGEGVTGIEKGDRVIFPCWFNADRGTLQQYALSEAVRTAKIPSTLSFDEAATIPLCLATAAMGLYGEFIEGSAEGGGIGLEAPWTDAGKGKYSGKPILIMGGSTSVGQYAIQLAKLSGFSPIIVTASQRNAEYCKAAGATHVIDYRETPYAQLHEAISKITTQSIEVVFDAVTREDSAPAGFQALAPGGGMVVLLPPPAPIKPGSRSADNKIVSFCVGNVNMELNQTLGNILYANIPKLLEDGSIKPNAVEVLPDGLAGASDGLKRLASWSVSASKLVVRPQDTA
ncbi:GroES-like protein [Peniophora sp. CONT]|nr:GroES-like protein [Peniophora sp. CONT]